MSNGTVRCWGKDNGGDAGDVTGTPQFSPIVVSGVANATQLTMADGYAAVRLSDGTGMWWGGPPGATGTLPAVAIPGVSGLTGLSLGTSHVCAKFTDASVKCWGRNTYGQIGDGTMTDRSVPTTIASLAGQPLPTLGLNLSCDTVFTGSWGVQCWGENGLGQVGNATTTDQSSPVDVAISGGFLVGTGMVFPGYQSTCAAIGGAAYCWGSNASGQLGDGTTIDKDYAVPVSGLGSGVVEVSIGVSDACAVLTSGTAKCWGTDLYGQLGDGGSATPRSAPVDVAGLTGIKHLAMGGTQTCALLTDGTVQCWGENSFGQLGDGTTTGRTTPGPVAW
jgi:alpha-tubulin suppressor-like RCC1 family protein